MTSFYPKASLLLAGTALVVAVGAAGSAQAQFALPARGFESFAQNPTEYTPEETVAVDLMLQWVDTTNDHDTPAHMALIGDNVAFRADPLEPLRRGAQGYCSAFGFVGSEAWFGLDELYLVGGPQDTLVLMARTDINAPDTGGGGLGGYPVPLAVLLRVQNGQLVEWYDMPINRVSIGALPFDIALGGELNIPERCQPYPASGDDPAPSEATAVTVEPAITYGTNQPEYWMNPFERAALQTVRAFFAARKAGDPLLLGAFVAPDATFRPDPADELGEGREGFLREICGYIGGDLDLNDLYVVGGDYDTAVLAGWDAYDADGNVSRMGTFFRVNADGLIIEWMDSAVDGPAPSESADPNSEACQTVEVALTPPPAPAGGPGGGPPGGGPPDGGAPDGAPPAGGPPPGG